MNPDDAGALWASPGLAPDRQTPAHAMATWPWHRVEKSLARVLLLVLLPIAYFSISVTCMLMPAGPGYYDAYPRRAGALAALALLLLVRAVWVLRGPPPRQRNLAALYGFCALLSAVSALSWIWRIDPSAMC